MDVLYEFFSRQLAGWQTAKEHFSDLEKVELKPLGMVKAQFNPARMVSTGAKIDKATLAKRPCFLCAKNRPPEQIVKEFNSNFEILINPFPILPVHFTIPSRTHELQKIEGKFGDMLHFVNQYLEILVFYNGPKCGASAPDHLHFQAGTRDILPVFEQWQQLEATAVVLKEAQKAGKILYVKDYVSPLLAITSSNIDDSQRLFEVVYNSLPLPENDIEPRINIVVWKQKEQFVTLVFPRYKHRPDCYSAEGEEQYLISPGAIDMSGLLIMPRKEDFDRITPEKAAAILREVSLPKSAMDEVIERIKKAK